MQVNNLKLWNSVEKTDPKYTKKAKIGGISFFPKLSSPLSISNFTVRKSSF